MRTTAYFRGEEETKWPEIAAAHKDPAVNAVANHVLAHPALLDDLSLVLLSYTRVIPSQAQPISQRYRKLVVGSFTPEQQTLATGLDQLYATQDHHTLDVLRGVVLERIVFLAVWSRKARHGDDVVQNLYNLAFPQPKERPPNPYSVDVCACFIGSKTVELYACKLHSEEMKESDLQYLAELGKYFGRRYTVVLGLCCLERASTIDPVVQKRIAKYPAIRLVTAEKLTDLKRT